MRGGRELVIGLTPFNPSSPAYSTPQRKESEPLNTLKTRKQLNSTDAAEQSRDQKKRPELVVVELDALGIWTGFLPQRREERGEDKRILATDEHIYKM